MAEVAEWSELLAARTDPVDALRLEMPLGRGEGGSSGSFWGRASDGNRWRVKPMNGPHGDAATMNEWIVGRLGAVIGAPVCDVSLIDVPAEVLPFEYVDGRFLEAGVTVASKEVVGCNELRTLEHRQRDENNRRHVGVLALYDWCLGGDPQWLYEAPDEDRIYSHDHGMYLGGDWRAQDLTGRLADPFVAGPGGDLDEATKTNLADRLEAITPEAVAAVLRTVPRSWPATDAQLAGLGEFLVARAGLVSKRVRSL